VGAGPEEAPAIWNPSAGRKGWESWGCSAWRRESCGESLEQLPVPGGAARELERAVTRAWGDKTRSKGFKLKEDRLNYI